MQKLLFGVIFGLLMAWYALAARKFFQSTIGRTVWFAALLLVMVPRVGSSIRRAICSSCWQRIIC